MENLPMAYHDMYYGKYMGKPIVEFKTLSEWDRKWFHKFIIAYI